MNPSPSSPTIVGAGLAGLIAAHTFPRAQILERSAAPVAGHRAVLRFRSDAVARRTGIDFRPVTVHKSIYSCEEHRAPNIALANAYARKVTGALSGDRSIWRLEAAQRWIAPESFHEQLVDAARGRIEWGCAANIAELSRGGTRVVSTAPLFSTLAAFGIDPGPEVEFKRAPIRVTRFRVPNADVHQTIYFPDPDTRVYRASMTGSLLIVESMTEDIPQMPRAGNDDEELEDVLAAFGIWHWPDPLDDAPQSLGKIVPLSDTTRRALLYRLTREHRIFSLGRFATWRNILLDDVVQDAAVIARLLVADDYERAHASA